MVSMWVRASLTVYIFPFFYNCTRMGMKFDKY